MFNQYYQQIVQVNGQPGAMAYQMMPNSSALLLDSTAPLVWLVKTDGAGYKSVTPFKIEKYEPAPPPDFQKLMDRIAKLEGKLNEYEKSNFATDGRNATEQSSAEWYAPTIVTD